jgi:hypothetical protein
MVNLFHCRLSSEIRERLSGKLENNLQPCPYNIGSTHIIGKRRGLFTRNDNARKKGVYGT